MREPRKCWRLLPVCTARGASNMALDQALLESAADEGFPPTLRFYRWSPPTISIGRFQSLDDLDLDACAREGIEVARRPTGGKCILHLDDFTYSITLPRGFTIPDGVVEAYTMICRGILAAFEELGVGAVIQSHEAEDYRGVKGACFSATTHADLEVAGRKLCGSAQVRRNGCMLQHGSIHLEDHSITLFSMLRFDHEEQRACALESYRMRCITLSDSGSTSSWEEVAASFVKGFRRSFRVEIEEGGLSRQEKRRWHELVLFHASPAWLENARLDALPPERAD
jgi:lipoate-protein ligase A